MKRLFSKFGPAIKPANPHDLQKNQILYAHAYTLYPGYMPAYSSGIPVEIVLRLLATIGNASTVNITISEGAVFATLDNLVPLTTKIYEDLDLYVDWENGDDDFGLGTEALPWKTPHRAMTFLADKYISQVATVTIHCADGEYAILYKGSLVLNHPCGDRIQMIGNQADSVEVAISSVGNDGTRDNAVVSGNYEDDFPVGGFAIFDNGENKGCYHIYSSHYDGSDTTITFSEDTPLCDNADATGNIESTPWANSVVFSWEGASDNDMNGVVLSGGNTFGLMDGIHLKGDCANNPENVVWAKDNACMQFGTKMVFSGFLKGLYAEDFAKIKADYCIIHKPYGWGIYTSGSARVKFDHGFFTTNHNGSYVFYTHDNSNLDANWAFVGGDHSSQYAVHANDNSRVACMYLRARNADIYASGATVECRGAEIYEGIVSVANNGRLKCYQATLHNGGYYASNLGKMYASGASALSGANGFKASKLGEIIADSTTATNQTGNGYMAEYGGTIYLQNENASGNTNDYSPAKTTAASGAPTYGNHQGRIIAFS